MPTFESLSLVLPEFDFYKQASIFKVIKCDKRVEFIGAWEKDWRHVETEHEKKWALFHHYFATPFTLDRTGSYAFFAVYFLHCLHYGKHQT